MISDFEKKLAQDVRNEIDDELVSIVYHTEQLNFLRQFLALIDLSAAQAPKRNYKRSKKSVVKTKSGKKIGRPTNAEKAAGLEEELMIKLREQNKLLQDKLLQDKFILL